MKKYIIGALFITLVISLSACGKKETAFTEKDLETISEKQFEELAQEKVGNETTAKVTETEADVIDYDEPDITIPHVNPFEEDLFAMFDLTDFPKPAEGYSLDFRYHTYGYKEETNQSTGEKTQLAGTEWCILKSNEEFYQGYMEEIISYLQETHPDAKFRSSVDRAVEPSEILNKPQACVFFEADGKIIRLRLVNNHIEITMGTATHKDEIFEITTYWSNRQWVATSNDGSKISVFFEAEDRPDIADLQLTEGDQVRIQYIEANLNVIPSATAFPTSLIQSVTKQ